jgi:hypothetical protein
VVGVVLVACSTVPLIGWRRSPLGVLVVTAAAGARLAGLGYRESPRGVTRLHAMGTDKFPLRGVSAPPRPAVA